MSFLLPAKMKISEVHINPHTLFIKLNACASSKIKFLLKILTFTCVVFFFNFIQVYLNKKITEYSETIVSFSQFIGLGVGRFECGNK